MNRNTRTLFVVGIALVLAGIAAWGVYRAISNLPVRTVQVAAQDVVVAKVQVPVGVLLTKEHLTVAGWPAGSPVPGGFANPDDVVGRGVTVALVVNEPVTEAKLAPKASGGGLPPLITPGMRAMTVRVNDVIGVAGFAQAGTRVDVILTLRENPISKTVLSNVQVLTADRRFDPEEGRQGQGANQAVVTLLLTPEDGEKLVLATQQGSIQLALRNPLDTAATETKGARMNNLIVNSAPEPAPARAAGPRRAAAPPPPPPAPPRPKTIEAIRGAKVSQEIIKCCL